MSESLTESVAEPGVHVTLLAGATAGVVVDIVLYPLDTIKTRMQSSQGFRAAGGFKGVYRGLSSAAAGSAPCAAVFFGTYETTKIFLQNQAPSSYGPLCHMAAAGCGEAVTAIVRMPFETVKQQVQAGQFKTPTECIRHIVNTQGPRGFWKGYVSLVLREIPFSFIQFPLYEFFKKSWSARDNTDRLEGWKASLCGSLAGGIAAGITTPLDVAKTRIVLSRDASMSISKVLKDVASKEGVRGLFSGIVPRVTWISIGGGVFFGAYEYSKQMFGRFFA